MEVEKLFEETGKVLGKAKEILVKDGEVPPVLFAFFPDGKVGFIPMGFSDKNEKDEQFEACREFLRVSMAEAGVFAAESFVVRLPASETPEGIIPSEHPERVDAISVTGAMDGVMIHAYVLFKKSENGKIIFFEESIRTNQKGSCRMFDGLFQECLPLL